MSEEETVSSEPTPNKPRGNGIALLALLLAVIAVGLVGFQQWQDWRDSGQVDDTASAVDAGLSDLGTRIDATRESITALESELQTLQSADGANADNVERLQRALAEQVRRIDALPSRIGGLEASLATLQGISAGARDRWLLGEAEYYLQLANAQLQLANNPEIASLALAMADERVAQLGDPALTPVRAAISNELAAIDAMDKPDIEGTTLKLSSLAGVTASLPLKDIRNSGEQAVEAEVTTDEEQGGFDRALNSMKGVVSGMVEYRTADENVMPLIAPEAEYFLRTNLSLQLESARLALLKGEQAIYEQSLADASNWLTTYFDPDSQAVQSAQATITELSDGQFVVSPPDISGSLRALRQFNALAESAQ